MSSANNARRPTPPVGHVHLVLFEQVHESFYLEIPVTVIRTVCLRPCKYLRYLGWCVLGIEGSLQDEQGHQVELSGNLVDQGVYHYRLPAAHQGFPLFFFVIDQELTTPQMFSSTLLTLKLSSCAAKHHLKQPQPGRNFEKNWLDETGNGVCGPVSCQVLVCI